MRSTVPIQPGTRFGRLTVLGLANPDEPAKYRRYRCLCDCGAEVSPQVMNLRAGRSKSCGCFKKDMAGEHGLKHGHSRRGSESRVFRIWRAMHNRCRNPNAGNYRYYGGRGIRVCERWSDFANFLTDMGEPSEGMSIDRYPNVNGNYEPGNCRWATQLEQVRNTRRRGA